MKRNKIPAGYETKHLRIYADSVSVLGALVLHPEEAREKWPVLNAIPLENFRKTAWADIPEFQMVLADPLYDLKDIDKAEYHRRFDVLCPDGVIVVYCPDKNPWVAGYDQKCYWVKAQSSKNTSKNYGRFVEEVFIYGRNAWNTDRHFANRSNVWFDYVDSTDDSPWRKPPPQIERLIYNHTQPGDWILDPYAGSFIVEEMARKLGCNTLSIEIEKPVEVVE